MSGLLGQLGPDERASAIDETIATLLARAGKFGDKASLEVLLRSAQNQSPPVQPSNSHAETAPKVRTLFQKPQEPAFLDKIEKRFADLASKIDQVQQQLVSGAESSFRLPAADAQSLEALVRNLSERIEAAQSPDAGHNATEALQQQIVQLSERLEHRDSGLAALPAIERSLQALFDHIEDTRRSVETTALKAAHEATAAVLAAGEHAAPAAVREIAALASLQEQADQRARNTLDTLQKTLEKVAGRLSQVEVEIANVRAPQPQIGPSLSSGAEDRHGSGSTSDGQRVRDENASSPRKKTLPDLLLGVSDLLDTPVSPAKPGRLHIAAAHNTADMDENTGHADFIAAARRAARTAQNDPSVLALKQMGKAPASASRADLMAKTRNYVETHKKPILMSIAALFVMFGTLAVMGTMQGEDGQGGARVAAKTAPSPKVPQAVSRPETGTARVSEASPRPDSRVTSRAGRVTAADLTASAEPPPGVRSCPFRS